MRKTIQLPSLSLFILIFFSSPPLLSSSNEKETILSQPLESESLLQKGSFSLRRRTERDNSQNHFRRIHESSSSSSSSSSSPLSSSIERDLRTGYEISPSQRKREWLSLSERLRKPETPHFRRREFGQDILSKDNSVLEEEKEIEKEIEKGEKNSIELEIERRFGAPQAIDSQRIEQTLNNLDGFPHNNQQQKIDQQQLRKEEEIQKPSSSSLPTSATTSATPPTTSTTTSTSSSSSSSSSTTIMEGENQTKNIIFPKTSPLNDREQEIILQKKGIAGRGNVALFLSASNPADPTPKDLVYLSHIPSPVVAICLTGELRSFELTIYGLFHYLVKYVALNSKRVDVFFSSFLTADSYKLALIEKQWNSLLAELPSANARLVTISMPLQYPAHRSSYRDLTVPKCNTGKNGIFGLFNLTLTCNEVILEQEQKEGFKYDTILKTRVDGLWYAFPDRLPLKFDKGVRRISGSFCYHVPTQWEFNGYNDRFSVGPRDLMILANDRFRSSSLLNKGSLMNSETSLKAELAVRRICVQKISCAPLADTPCPLPFCVLRTTTPANGPIVTRDNHHRIFDGGKCKPCTMQQAYCTKRKIENEWLELFKEMTSFEAVAPVRFLNFLKQDMNRSSDCIRVLKRTLRDINFKSGVTLRDTCLISGASEYPMSFNKTASNSSVTNITTYNFTRNETFTFVSVNLTQITFVTAKYVSLNKSEMAKFNPEWMNRKDSSSSSPISPLDILSSSAQGKEKNLILNNRALRSWSLEQRCLRYPKTCSPWELELFLPTEEERRREARRDLPKGQRRVSHAFLALRLFFFLTSLFAFVLLIGIFLYYFWESLYN